MALGGVAASFERGSPVEGSVLHDDASLGLTPRDIFWMATPGHVLILNDGFSIGQG